MLTSGAVKVQISIIQIKVLIDILFRLRRGGTFILIWKYEQFYEGDVN